MTLTIQNNESNTVEASDASLNSLNGHVTFTGSGGVLSIGEGCSSAALAITIGDNCSVTIGRNCNLSALEIYTMANSAVSVGANSGFTWRTTMHCHDPYDIHIGEDCLFASGTMLTVSDMHSIIDAQTGELLNQSASIAIGNHVWLGQDAAVLKGVHVGHGAVIGFRSVVTKPIPARSLAVGCPAKVVKHGVTWDYRTPTAYSEQLSADGT